MPFLDSSQVAVLGFKSVGNGVLISDRAAIYGAERISLGNNVRIDDFCLLSAGEGGIEIGNYIHIAAYSSLIGKALIRLMDFSGLSSRVSVYSSSDDYSGKSMTNPMVPEEFRNVKSKPVIIGRHVIVGAGAVLLPGIEIGDGSAIGALSLVSKSVEPGVIVSGNPARTVTKRSDRIFTLEAAMFGLPNQTKEDN
ncbi:MAG TPA: acyltransferase [Panacibacter sp.]|nr:acyltransferase [Panacibacter sp.]HNP46538.1 acyltransferase [Panacibacter sp.]